MPACCCGLRKAHWVWRCVPPTQSASTRCKPGKAQLFPDVVGLYRIEQLPQATRAQTLQGRLRFESDRSGGMQRAWLRDGEQADFWWADGPRTEHQALVRDGFANWLLGQASATVAAGTASEEYVSSEMTGVEELDRNGRWEQAPEYGNVWIPTQVAPGWEPYRDGRWVWTRNWGWSWVDDSPWGFAPFHYGRWVVWRGRWGWTPGHYVARPVYAPALVTWRQAPGLTIGVTLRQPPPRGSWAPLPPREVYVPTYRHSDDYRNRLNRPYDGRPGAGPDTPRNTMGPQRDYPREAPRGVPHDSPRDTPRDMPRDTRPWNEGPRDQPRRPDVGAPPPVRNGATPPVAPLPLPVPSPAPSPVPVAAPPVQPQPQPAAPARPEAPAYSPGYSPGYSGPQRGRDRERERDNGWQERHREAPPSSIAPPVQVPVAPAARPAPAPMQAPAPVMAPPAMQRPPTPQPPTATATGRCRKRAPAQTA